jgi:hypothetical protein
MGKYLKVLPILLLAMAFAAFPLAYAGQSNDEKIETGKLVGVDTEHQTFTIRTSNDVEMQFEYNETTKVEGSQNGVQGLSTKTGTQVSVHYKPEEDRRVATRIEILKLHPRYR